MRRTNVFRTSSFRLAAIYLALFTASVLILGATVSFVVWREIAGEIDADIQGETSTLTRDFAAHGRDRLQATVEARSRGVGSFVYGLEDAQGRLVAGQLAPRAGGRRLDNPACAPARRGEADGGSP